MDMIMSDVQCLAITDFQIQWSLSVLLTLKVSAITLRFYTFVPYNSHKKTAIISPNIMNRFFIVKNEMILSEAELNLVHCLKC